MRKEAPIHLIQLYTTEPYPCSYLAGCSARSQTVAPGMIMDVHTFSELLRHGFRRSGLFIYRPHCDTCQACIPARIPVADFQPSRSQRRAWKRHGSTLQVIKKPLIFSEEHFELYRTYQSHRHKGGGMDEDCREQYAQFLLQTPTESHLLEFRDQDYRLKMVSISDELDDGFSCVYTYYDVQNMQDSLGTFSILWQLEACRALGLPYLYLGYWIQDSPKMAYKTRFFPLELFRHGKWSRYNDSATTLATQ